MVQNKFAEFLWLIFAKSKKYGATWLFKTRSDKGKDKVLKNINVDICNLLLTVLLMWVVDIIGQAFKVIDTQGF